MRFITFLFVLTYTLFSCIEEKVNLHTPDFQTFQITDKYHNSEAKLVAVDNGLIMIYRKDTSYSHVSNAGELVLRRSFDNGNTWTSEESIYNSPYDDRNLIADKLPNGQIIIIFRRYDYNKDITIDSGYILGNNFGKNWSTYTPIKETRGLSNQPFGKIFLYKDKYPGFLVQFGHSETVLFYSKDNYANRPLSTLIMKNDSVKLHEPNLINLGQGNSVILYRNGDNRKGAPSYIQYVSIDWEKYSNMGGTNMFDDYAYPVSSPVSIRLSTNNDYIEVTGNSRRLFQSEENLTNEIRIYRINSTDILKNPKNYSLFQRIERPWPSKHWLYGYPDFVEIKSQSKFLYIFTEGKIHKQEQIPVSHLNNEEAQLFTYFL
jgi:hypothetical protein